MNKSAILTYKGENSRKTNYPFGRYLQKNKQKKPQSHMIPNSALHFSEFAKILNSWPVSWNIVSLRERNMGSIIFFLCEIYHSQKDFFKPLSYSCLFVLTKDFSQRKIQRYTIHGADYITKWFSWVSHFVVVNLSTKVTKKKSTTISDITFLSLFYGKDHIKSTPEIVEKSRV